MQDDLVRFLTTILQVYTIDQKMVGCAPDGLRTRSEPGWSRHRQLIDPGTSTDRRAPEVRVFRIFRST
jgi:hypothetical protein